MKITWKAIYRVKNFVKKQNFTVLKNMVLYLYDVFVTSSKELYFLDEKFLFLLAAVLVFGMFNWYFSSFKTKVA